MHSVLWAMSGGKCSCLNENDPHRLMFESLLPSGAVRELLGGMTLSEEVCYWGWALRFQKHMLGSVSLSAYCLWRST